MDWNTGQFGRKQGAKDPHPTLYSKVTRESKFIWCKNLPGVSAVRLEWIEIEQFASL